MTRLIGSSLIELTAGTHHTTLTLDEFEQVVASLHDNPALHLRVAEYRDRSGLTWVLDELFVNDVRRHVAAMT